jgi:hypothetical protein
MDNDHTQSIKTFYKSSLKQGTKRLRKPKKNYFKLLTK